MLHLDCQEESWPIAGTFTIARGSKTAANVVVATISNGEHQGHGEAVPYARYHETVEATLAALQIAKAEIENGTDETRAQGDSVGLHHLLTRRAIARSCCLFPHDNG